MTEPTATIAGRTLGAGHPALIVAELSGNHGGDLGRAIAIVDAVADAGADAVKFQTYTPDSLTLDVDDAMFTIGEGTQWSGRRLYDLYAEAMTPWEWMSPLFERARSRGLLAFSTPFDQAAVELLEQLDPPAHKVASFELVDHDLLRLVAATGRPVVASTGMATEDEIEDAITVLREAGAKDLVLLRCTSAYPAPVDEMDLRSIGEMRDRWRTPVGLSDHTLSSTAAVVAVALGASLVEKHVTLCRADGGPDASFSLEPHELETLVATVREAERSLGCIRFGPSRSEEASVAFRRSLFFVRELRAGDVVGPADVRSVRPGYGLPPKHRSALVGRRLRVNVTAGTPVTWEALVSDEE